MKMTDTIETFILTLLDEDNDMVELQRSELARHFGCAPSQINYVLATRFTPERGYMIESRRGGGGYIRVIRVNMEGANYISYLLTEGIGEALSQDDAREIIRNLYDRELIDAGQARIMAAGLSDSAYSPFGGKGMLRVGVLKSMLLSILQEL